MTPLAPTPAVNVPTEEVEQDQLATNAEPLLVPFAFTDLLKLQLLDVLITKVFVPKDVGVPDAVNKTV